MSLFRTQLKQRIARLEAAAAARLARANGRRLLTRAPDKFWTGERIWPGEPGYDPAKGEPQYSGQLIEFGSPEHSAWQAERLAAGEDVPPWTGWWSEMCDGWYSARGVGQPA
jgi:hypothetical protein